MVDDIFTSLYNVKIVSINWSKKGKWQALRTVLVKHLDIYFLK